MNVAVDTSGKAVPAVEMPSAEKLRVYGDMMFLAFRSARHSEMSVRTLRTYFEPAIESGQFRVFRFDDVPRGMYTWAMLSPAAERKLITGQALLPQDWQSGDRMWIIDMIVPYGGLMSSIGRWIMKRGNLTDTEFLFRRVTGHNNTRRIVHVDFRNKKLARVMADEQFLQTLDESVSDRT